MFKEDQYFSSLPFVTFTPQLHLFLQERILSLY